LIVDRGIFLDLPPYHERMLKISNDCLISEGLKLDRDPLRLLEITTRPATRLQPPSDAEVLDRVARVNPLGPIVLSDFAEVFELALYLRRFTQEPIRFAIGVSLLALILQDRFYDELPGTLLEGLGKLLGQGVKLYAFPMPHQAVLQALGDHASRFIIQPDENGLVSVDNLYPRPPVNHLLAYLRNAGWITPLAAPHSP
jgi:hypothetical protein